MWWQVMGVDRWCGDKWCMLTSDGCWQVMWCQVMHIDRWCGDRWCGDRWCVDRWCGDKWCMLTGDVRGEASEAPSGVYSPLQTTASGSKPQWPGSDLHHGECSALSAQVRKMLLTVMTDWSLYWLTTFMYWLHFDVLIDHFYVLIAFWCTDWSHLCTDWIITFM